MDMTSIEIEEVKTELLRRVEQHGGEEIIQHCRRGLPIGLIRFMGAVAPLLAEPRPIGLAAGTFTVPPKFFEPLPDDLVKLFSGGGQ